MKKKQDFCKSYMQDALKLSLKASIWSTLPNPRVGAVIVKKGKIIATGYHKKYGGLHAEAMAFARLKTGDAQGSDLYCSLEPCFGTWAGKHQEACVNIILQHKIARLYIAVQDPNPRVMGKSIALLKKRGVKVELMPEFALEVCRINEAFFALQKSKRLPFVHVKIAQSLDAYMAAHDGSSTFGRGKSKRGITSEESRRCVHKIRSQSHAICAGVNTIIADNPQYNLRYTHEHKDGKSPACIIFDTMLRTPIHSKCLKVCRRAPGTVIFTSKDAYAQESRRKLLEAKNVTVRIGTAAEQSKAGSQIDIFTVLTELFDMGVYSLMVESGAQLSNAFLASGFTHKITLFIAALFLGSHDNVHKLCFKSDISPSYMQTLHYPQSSIVKNTNDVMLSGYMSRIFPQGMQSTKKM